MVMAGDIPTLHSYNFAENKMPFAFGVDDEMGVLTLAMRWGLFWEKRCNICMFVFVCVCMCVHVCVREKEQLELKLKLQGKSGMVALRVVSLCAVRKRHDRRDTLWFVTRRHLFLKAFYFPLDWFLFDSECLFRRPPLSFYCVQHPQHSILYTIFHILNSQIYSLFLLHIYQY